MEISREAASAMDLQVSTHPSSSRQMCAILLTLLYSCFDQHWTRCQRCNWHRRLGGWEPCGSLHDRVNSYISSEASSLLPIQAAIIDFAGRALHMSTVAAKAIVEGYYGSKAKKSYYSGCSTGGR